MQIQLLLLACLCAGSLAYANSRKVCPTLGVYRAAHDTSCTKYYICFNQQLMEQECATGLMYDKELQHCVAEHLTQCRLDLCPPDEWIKMVANPNDCSRYYICTRGVATNIQCPTGLKFNSVISSCDFEENVTCLSEEEDRTIDEINIVCPAKGVSRVANPKDCSQYSICLNGSRMDYQCTGDLKFDIRTKRCNIAESSRCFA